VKVKSSLFGSPSSASTQGFKVLDEGAEEFGSTWVLCDAQGSHCRLYSKSRVRVLLKGWEPRRSRICLERRVWVLFWPAVNFRRMFDLMRQMMENMNVNMAVMAEAMKRVVQRLDDGLSLAATVDSVSLRAWRLGLRFSKGFICWLNSCSSR
jgi:hypothetical protein